MGPFGPYWVPYGPFAPFGLWLLMAPPPPSWVALPWLDRLPDFYPSSSYQTVDMVRKVT